MNEFNVLLGAATNGTPSGSLFDALFARYIAPQESWRELESPLPITILSAGEDLIDYRIYGNTAQTSTPTPENPIIPSGCGERTVNIYNWHAAETSRGFVQGYNLDSNGNQVHSSNWCISEYIEVAPSTVYNIAWFAGNAFFAYFCEYDENYNFISSHLNTTTSIFTTSSRTKFLRLSNVYRNSTKNRREKCVLVEGSTAPTSYIPYGYKLPLTSASQDVDIYLGENQTTRRIKKLVLTGEEYTWSDSYWVNAYVLFSPPSGTRPAPVSDIGICSHFVQQSTNTLSSGRFNIRYTTNVVIGFGKSGFSTLNDFKSFLAQQYANGTPVTVWYVLAEPETGIVNEPLMKIGNYADTVSMEQAGVSIPTNKGSTVIDYDGTLKPSQMYIKYKS